jgi:hypothetical protein
MYYVCTRECHTIYATQAKTENYGKSLVFGSSKNAFFDGTGHLVSGTNIDER